MYYYWCIFYFPVSPSCSWPQVNLSGLFPYKPYTIFCVVNGYFFINLFCILICVFCLMFHSSLYFPPFLFSFFRHSEEEHFRGVHLFSSCRPPCTLRDLRVPHQETICKESDLPGLGIPQQFHFLQCTTALWTHCMSQLNIYIEINMLSVDALIQKELTALNG